MQNNRTQQGVKKVVITIAALIYAVAVIYGDIMFLQIINRVFPNGFLGTLALLGAFVAGMTALLLPIALHWWHAQGVQQVVGYLFYAVDFTMLALNAMLAYQILSNAHLDQFFSAWLQVTPATPLICAVGWGLVFSLDSSHQARHAQENLHADLNETYAQRLTNASNSPAVQHIIDQAAQLHAQQTVQRLLGVVVNPEDMQRLQIQQPMVQPMPAPQQKQGFWSRFWNGPQSQVQPIQLPQQASTYVPSNAITGQYEVMQPDPLAQRVSLNQSGTVQQLPNQDNQNGKANL